MAQFKGTVQGSRGYTSRLGGKNSGLQTSCNGWNCGIDVVAFVNEKGIDSFRVILTGGSNGRCENKEIGIFTHKDLPFYSKTSK